MVIRTLGNMHEAKTDIVRLISIKPTEKKS